MSRIAVIGGTGYAGAAIVAEAASRGHDVVALSRTRPETPVDGVTYVEGDATDDGVLASVIAEADAVVAALAPRAPLTDVFRDVYRTIGRLADGAGATLFVVGGFSSLRPAADADRYVADLSKVPAELQPEILNGAALITEDLPATPETLEWVFVSPALNFGAHVPGERTGAYRLGGEIAVEPGGGDISAPDYAIGLVDLIESGDHHRAHVNLAR